MIAALGLLAYALALSIAAPQVLCGARWADRAPRVAVAAWQGVTLSVVLAVVFGAVALTVPTMRVSGNLAAVMQECVLALRDRYASPGGATLAATGAVLALGVLARVAWCVAAALTRALRARRRIRELLRFTGRTDRAHGVVVVDHDIPAAYCVPGLRHRVVLTTGAVAALEPRQLRAVIAHERAHLWGRHDLVIAGALALTAAFPRIRVFRAAQEEIVRLVELLADDAATRRTDRLTVAEALLALAGGSPAGALAAGGGSAAAARVRRLIAGHRPVARARRVLGSLAIAGLLTVPVLLLAAPAAMALGSHYCPKTSAVVISADCPVADCGSVHHSTRRDDLPSRTIRDSS
jgi:Zn-dependent protease with chaperone function